MLASNAPWYLRRGSLCLPYSKHCCDSPHVLAGVVLGALVSGTELGMAWDSVARLAVTW